METDVKQREHDKYLKTIQRSNTMQWIHSV